MTLQFPRVLAEINAYGPIDFRPTARDFAKKLDAAIKADTAQHGANAVAGSPDYQPAQARIRSLLDFAASSVNRVSGGGR